MPFLRQTYDAIVIGAGPNGLAAAITLARAGKSVAIVEARDTIGGGMRTVEYTVPGFHHDVCSSVYPLSIASPFFQSLPLQHFGVEWIHSPAVLAHPMADGNAAIMWRSLEQTSVGLGSDAQAYSNLYSPLVQRWGKVAPLILSPLGPTRHLEPLMRFGLPALVPAQTLARLVFRTDAARGLFAGLCAHAMVPLHRVATSAFGLVLGIAGHVGGWPFPRGGANRIASALVAYLQVLQVEIITEYEVQRIDNLPSAKAYLFDVTPRQLLSIAGHRFTPGYRAALNAYRYGPGVCKIDYALDGPVPWRAKECALAATVHLGGTLAEIAHAEAAIWQGQHPEIPYVLVAQHSLFDTTRAPDGKHTLWTYCHVPNGSMVDMTDRIETQIERFAPGFRNRILARHTMFTADFEQHNPNYIGGDINGGAQDIGQLFTRPAARVSPYSTPDPQIFICSSSTPPGGGVHGMCGYHAAAAVLQRLR